jgi:mersacidin/lichenicidin family type 2 lantibiotic
MKFDRIRVWKDEQYCQNLSQERLNALSTNLASELTDVELESVYGGSVGLGASASLASDERIHSFSVLCDINIFSLNAIVIPVLSIASTTNQTCANED